MKQSKLYIPTQKNVPSSAEIKSHKLLLKAGYIHQNASGLYTYLPMATKVLSKIEQIVREELDKIDANEIRMPFLEPSEIWEQTGRWQEYGEELFRVEDRRGRSYALAPTHEEIATDILKNYLNSYKKLPVNIYQIQTKMRDERRPRFGLLRGREFIMMDGYAFAEDETGLKELYDEYYEAYKKIFKRLNLDFKIVKADNGTMGGQYSHEFMALSDVGEDFIAYDENSQAYNTEIAPVKNSYEQEQESKLEQAEFDTPGIKKLEDLQKNYDINLEKMIKAICYNIDQKLVICFVLGTRNVEETKVLNLLGGSNIELASHELLLENKVTPGFIGPNISNEEITIIYDQELKFKRNLTTGANKFDKHLKNYNFSEADLNVFKFADIRSIEEGDIICENGSPIKIAKGIEIGHIFALGKKYTESLGVEVLNKEQKKIIPTMGSFGIGISRLLATIVEQHSDENGIILPTNISPYQIHILPLDYSKDEEQKKYTDEIVKKLEEKNIPYLLDDRNERAGSKFKDADLIGIPLSITIGKKYKDDIIEIKHRTKSEKEEISSINFLAKI